MTIREKVDEVLGLFNQIEELKQEYNYKRGELLHILKQNNLDEVDFRGGKVVKVERHIKVDEQKLRAEYPEVFLAGMTYRFSEKKAKENYPRNIVRTALKNCSREVSEYVTIQFDKRGRKT